MRAKHSLLIEINLEIRKQLATKNDSILRYEHEDILEACVFGIPDERLGEILCAAIYLREDSKLSINELQSFLSTKLASFKIPVNIKYYKNKLPRVGSGKFEGFCKSRISPFIL